MTKRIRKQIEWHFYNYTADREIYDERVAEIAESGIVANYAAVGGQSAPANPTERKGLLINDLSTERTWATVVRNTFTAFRFDPEYDLMQAMYVDGKKPKEIYESGFTSASTFWRARERWLKEAYDWAQLYGLLR